MARQAAGNLQWSETIVTIVASTIVFALSQSLCQLRYVSSFLFLLFLSFASESKINSKVSKHLSVFQNHKRLHCFSRPHELINSLILHVGHRPSTFGQVNVASFGESAAFWQGRTYQLLRDDEKPSMCISDPAGGWTTVCVWKAPGGFCCQCMCVYIIYVYYTYMYIIHICISKYKWTNSEWILAIGLKNVGCYKLEGIACGQWHSDCICHYQNEPWGQTERSGRVTEVRFHR